MAGPVSLDTNCLLRWVLQDIPEQAAATARVIDSHIDIKIADIAIWEMVYVLEILYKLPRSIIAGHVKSLMNLENVNCNMALFERALPIYVKHPALSFTDVCLTFYAELNSAIPLYTFDKKLAAQLELARVLK